MTLPYLTIAWSVGILLAARLALPPAFWLVLLLPPLASLPLYFREPRLRLAAALAVLALLGAFRYQSALPAPGPLAALNGQGPLTFIGLVDSEPEIDGQHRNLILNVSRLRTDGPWQDTEGRVRLQLARDADARYGDQLEVYGELTTPPNDADFSYRDFLARDGIFSLAVARGYTVMQRDLGNPFLASLYDLRTRGLVALKTLFPEPSASVLSGILLGYDSEIPSALAEAFKSTNTSHVLAISGFNIAVIAGLLGGLGRRLPRLVAQPISILLIIGYTLLVGASASVVRAAIMGILVLLAPLFRRQAWAGASLAAAVLVMTALNPRTLWDLGFQLSFLATLGLILLCEPLARKSEEWLSRLAGPSFAKSAVRFFNESVIVTAAATLFTAPLLIVVFHRFSLVGFLTNFLVLPVQPPVMILGGLALLAQFAAGAAASVPFVSLLAAGIAGVIAFAAYVVTQYTILIVQWTAGFPFGSFDIPLIDSVWLVAFYLLILLPRVVSPRVLAAALLSTPGRLMAALAVIVVLGWSVAFALPDPRTHIQFVATSSGQAVFVRTARGSRILIDGSGDPAALLAHLGEQTAFWDRRLDLVVLTNSDETNIASLNAVLERYDVGQVVEPPIAENQRPSYSRWRELLRGKGIPSLNAVEGTRVDADEVSIQALSPEDMGDSNNTALLVSAGKERVVLAYSLDANDLDAPAANGSDWSADFAALPLGLDPTLLGRIDPAMAVLYAGQARGEQPKDAALALLAGRRVLRTDESGDIEIVIDGEKVEVRTER